MSQPQFVLDWPARASISGELEVVLPCRLDALDLAFRPAFHGRR